MKEMLTNVTKGQIGSTLSFCGERDVAQIKTKYSVKKCVFF